MTSTNENLQQAYMMLVNSKQYLWKAKEEWLLQQNEMNDICDKISAIQDRVYELIHFFDKVDESSRH